MSERLRLDGPQLKGVSNHGKFRIPEAISAQCPNCLDKVAFLLRNPLVDGLTLSVLIAGICPACAFKASFTIHYKNGDGENAAYTAIVAFIFPAPKRRSIERPELENDVPEALKRALFEAIDAYNAGIYGATSAVSRRAMEGIFKHLSPEGKKDAKLYHLIEEFKKTEAISEPIVKLAHAVRDGGNLGAHFDLEREPDEESARHMIELVTYLFGFFFQLPKKISLLEERNK